MRCFPLLVIASLAIGFAIAPASAQQLQCSPCQHAFGKVRIGESGSYSINLINTGDSLLRISSLSVDGSAFSIGNFALPVKLRSGASVQLPVTFAPTVQGWVRGIVILTSNDPRSPLYVSLYGHGVGQSSTQLGINPASLNFGKVDVGSSATVLILPSTGRCSLTRIVPTCWT